jgi:hypothetical protein
MMHLAAMFAFPQSMPTSSSKRKAILNFLNPWRCSKIHLSCQFLITERSFSYGKAQE